MKTMPVVINLLLILLTTLPVFAGEQPAEDRLNIEGLMTFSEYKAAGLNKQTPGEIKALNAWLNKFVSGKPMSASTEVTEEKILEIVEKGKKKSRLELIGSSKVPYEIQRVKGKRLKIKNMEFEMIRICKGFNEGDKVKLIKGNIHGVCDMATFEHTVSGERCEVYCDSEEMSYN